MKETLNLCFESFAIAQVSWHDICSLFTALTSLCTKPVIDLIKIGKEKGLDSLIFTKKV